MNRLRHYLSRVKSLDVRNMLVVTTAVATESGKSRLVILLDMILCSIVYQAGYLDFQEFEFWSLNRSERRTWITSGNANLIVVKYNQRPHRYKFSDKIAFNRLFGSYLGREWLDVRESTAVEMQRFLTRHGGVMAKRIDGMGGAGIRKYHAGEIDDVELFRAELLTNEQYLVEALIIQHPRMATLSPSSVNSLRMITFFDGDTVHVMEAVLRMGNGAEVDNYARGGMYTVLDEVTGVAPFAAFDRFAHKFSEHPATGTPITGFEVPLYQDVLSMLDAVSRVVPQIPYVGWDVAIAENGPLIIEGNYNTGVFQMKPSLSGIRTGLLPRFRSVIDF